MRSMRHNRKGGKEATRERERKGGKRKGRKMRQKKKTISVYSLVVYETHLEAMDRSQRLDVPSYSTKNPALRTMTLSKSMTVLSEPRRGRVGGTEPRNDRHVSVHCRLKRDEERSE